MQKSDDNGKCSKIHDVMKKVHFYENEKEARWNEELSITSALNINTNATRALVLSIHLIFPAFCFVPFFACFSIAIVSTYKRQKLIHSHIITQLSKDPKVKRNSGRNLITEVCCEFIC